MNEIIGRKSQAQTAQIEGLYQDADLKFQGVDALTPAGISIHEICENSVLRDVCQLVMEYKRCAWIEQSLIDWLAKTSTKILRKDLTNDH